MYQVDAETEKRQRELTRQAILKIARAKIEAYGLKDTAEEYIAKCVENTLKAKP